VGLLLSAVRAEDIDRQRGRRALGISGAQLRHTAANASSVSLTADVGSLFVLPRTVLPCSFIPKRLLLHASAEACVFLINKQA